MARLASLLKKTACLVASSLTVIAPVLEIHVFHVRDFPSPEELPNNQAVACS